MQPFRPSRVSNGMRNAEPIPAVFPFDPAASITCRPGKAAAPWVILPGVMAFYCGVMACLCLPIGLGTWSAAVTLAVFCAIGLAGMIPAIVWARRGAIIADETGLRWRGLGAWKSVRWGEVRDYYERLPPQNKGSSITYRALETAAGRLNVTSQWKNADTLWACVEGRATASAVQEWGVLGTRPCDPWPRTFRYDTWQNIWTPRLLIKLMGFILTFLLAKPVTQAAALAGFVSWPMKLGLFAPSFLMASMLLLLPLVLLSRYRATGRRRAERITADLDGIVFEDKARRVEARWADLTSYQIAAGPGAVTVCYRVETRQGDFDFLPTLSEFLIFKEIVRRYAKNAAENEWKHQDSPEVLGGEAARWSGGQEDIGARVFHYQTRSVRALLWGGIILLLSLCAMVVLVRLVSLPGSAPLPFLPNALFGLASVLGLFYGWRLYRHCGVHLDDDGLTQFTPLGQTRILWSLVDKFYLGSDKVGVVEGRNGRRIRFSAAIVGREELMAEIARRAADCGRTVWEKRLSA